MIYKDSKRITNLQVHFKCCKPFYESSNSEEELTGDQKIVFLHLFQNEEIKSILSIDVFKLKIIHINLF